MWRTCQGPEKHNKLINLNIIEIRRRKKLSFLLQNQYLCFWEGRGGGTFAPEYVHILSLLLYPSLRSYQGRILRGEATRYPPPKKGISHPFNSVDRRKSREYEIYIKLA